VKEKMKGGRWEGIFEARPSPTLQWGSNAHSKQQKSSVTQLSHHSVEGEWAKGAVEGKPGKSTTETLSSAKAGRKIRNVFRVDKKGQKITKRSSI